MFNWEKLIFSAESMSNLATMYVAEHNLQDIGLEMGIGHACKSLSEGHLADGIQNSGQSLSAS